MGKHYISAHFDPKNPNYYNDKFLKNSPLFCGPKVKFLSDALKIFVWLQAMFITDFI